MTDHFVIKWASRQGGLLAVKKDYRQVRTGKEARFSHFFAAFTCGEGINRRWLLFCPDALRPSWRQSYLIAQRSVVKRRIFL
jgi:hypothetical protein